MVRGAVCQELTPSKILLSPAPASHSEEIGDSIWTDRGRWAVVAIILTIVDEGKEYVDNYYTYTLCLCYIVEYYYYSGLNPFRFSTSRHSIITLTLNAH